MSLSEEIRSSINRCNRENVSNTPDFILADYLLACLVAFESASLHRETWYGKHLQIVDSNDLNINEKQSSKLISHRDLEDILNDTKNLDTMTKNTIMLRVIGKK